MAVMTYEEAKSCYDKASIAYDTAIGEKNKLMALKCDAERRRQYLIEELNQKQAKQQKITKAREEISSTNIQENFDKERNLLNNVITNASQDFAIAADSSDGRLDLESSLMNDNEKASDKRAIANLFDKFKSARLKLKEREEDLNKEIKKIKLEISDSDGYIRRLTIQIDEQEVQKRQAESDRDMYKALMRKL